MDFRTFWKKYGEPVVGISIIIFFIFAGTMMYKDLQIKKEIENNCGWEKEDYRCYCQKAEVIAIENQLGLNDLEINLSERNATLD